MNDEKKLYDVKSSIDVNKFLTLILLGISLFFILILSKFSSCYVNGENVYFSVDKMIFLPQVTSISNAYRYFTLYIFLLIAIVVTIIYLTLRNRRLKLELNELSKAYFKTLTLETEKRIELLRIQEEEQRVENENDKILFEKWFQLYKKYRLGDDYSTVNILQDGELDNDLEMMIKTVKNKLIIYPYFEESYTKEYLVDVFSGSKINEIDIDEIKYFERRGKVYQDQLIENGIGRVITVDDRKTFLVLANKEIIMDYDSYDTLRELIPTKEKKQIRKLNSKIPNKT